MSLNPAGAAPGIGPELPAAKRRDGLFGIPWAMVLMVAAIAAVVFAGTGLAIRVMIDRDRVALEQARSTIAGTIDTLERDVLELLVDYAGLIQDPDMAGMLVAHPRRTALTARWVSRYSEVDIAIVADRSGRFAQLAEAGELRLTNGIASAQSDLSPFLNPWLARHPGPGDTLTGIVRLGEVTMLAAAIPVRQPPPQSGAPLPADFPAYLIGLRHLERDVARMLTRDFGFTGVALVTSAPAHHSHPIHLWDGRAAGFITWETDPLHPHSPTWLGIAILLPAGLLIGGLVWRLRRHAESEARKLERKSAEFQANEKLIADIRTGIRQLSWNLSEGVVLLQAPEGSVKYANAAAARLLGRGAENLLGTPFADQAEGRFPALARHLRGYLATDPGQWSGDASWFSEVGTDGRMVKVGIHEFRRGDVNRIIGLLITETVWNQLGDPLDRIGIGVICLDGEGRLMAANALAADLCRQMKVPLEGEQAIGAAQVRLLDVLRPALERVERDEVASLAVSTGNAEPVIATLIPLPAAEEGGSGGGVFVLLRDPGRPVAADAALLADLFGLTPAECRVALRTAAGASAEALAEELGLSPHTVRNHLKSVMRKTSTSKQGETVALLWRLAAYTGERREGPTA